MSGDGRVNKDDIIRYNSDGVPDLDLTIKAIAEVVSGRATDSHVRGLGEQVTQLHSDLRESNDKREFLQKSLDELKVRYEAGGGGGEGPKPLEWDPIAGGGEQKAFGYGRSAPDWVKKDIATNDNTPGARVSNVEPYMDLKEGNPLDGFVSKRTVTGATFKVPFLTSVDFGTEASIPLDNHATDRVNQGTLTSSDVTIDTYTAQVLVPEPAAEDVSGLEDSVTRILMARASTAMGAAIYKVIKDDVKAAGPTITTVSDGDADKAPTAAQVEAALRSMYAGISTAYRGGSAFALSISRGIESSTWAIRAANASYEFSLRDGVDRFRGAPILVSDNLDVSDTAKQCGAVMGNFMYGILCGDREEFMLQRYTATVPGAWTYFARFRFKPVIWDKAALITLISKD